MEELQCGADCGLSVFSVLCCNLCKGAQVNASNRLRKTALILESRYGHVGVVELLLDAGDYMLEHINSETKHTIIVYQLNFQYSVSFIFDH